MTLPSPFSFNQNNLQDYQDCPRRFELRHVQHLEWPAVETEPYLEAEHRMLLGTTFHNMIRQAIAGVPIDALTDQVIEPEVARWWQAWMAFYPTLPQGKRWAEFSTSVPFHDDRINAVFDLLVVQPDDRITIFDWKTTPKRLKGDMLLRRLQTMVYPWLALRMARQLVGHEVKPDSVQMVYWFTSTPELPQVIQYSSELDTQNTSLLENIISEIRNAPSYPLTTDTRHCKYCKFRSLCDRGSRAGSLNEQDMADDHDRSLDDLNFANLEPL